MKLLLIAIFVLDGFLLAGAGIRVMTADQTTLPLISFSSSESAPAPVAAQEAESAGHRDAVVGHLNRSKRIDEIGETSNLSTLNPSGNTGSSATGSLERASDITDGREDDLQDAKSKIGKIGK
jgi:hypothetical protein